MDGHNRPVGTTQQSEIESDEVAFVLAAAEEGYFEVPREISLVELAKQEGISDVTASEQLRQGIKRIVTHTDR